MRGTRFPSRSQGGRLKVVNQPVHNFCTRTASLLGVLTVYCRVERSGLSDLAFDRMDRKIGLRLLGSMVVTASPVVLFPDNSTNNTPGS